MYCKKCGAGIDEGTKFCKSCGCPVETQDEHSSDENTDLSTQSENDVVKKRVFNFVKKKQIGRFTYKTTTTHVTVDGNDIEINQTIRKFLGGTSETKNKVLKSDITGAVISKTFDFWDTLYAIIFTILALLLNLLFLLVAAICLFCAYGKMIKITTNKDTIHIPLQGSAILGSSTEAEEFILLCKSK